MLSISISVAIAKDLHTQVLEAKIKNSGAYRWGESIDKDPVKAWEMAKHDLTQKIYVTLSASTEQTLTESNQSFEREIEVVTKSYSALQLLNLEKLIIPEKRKMVRVIAYIDTASLSLSFEASKKKVRDMVKLALQAESENRIGDALRGFYWSYLLTHTIVGDLDLLLEGIEISNARLVIVKKLKEIIAGIKIQSEPCYRTAGSSNTTLTLTYNDSPIQNIDFSYYCADGDDQVSITDGERAYITIYKELTQHKAPLPLRIEYIYPGEMLHQPEILNLYKIFKDKRFDLFVTADLIVPWVPEVKIKSRRLEIKPLPKPVLQGWSISIRILADISNKIDFQKELTKLNSASILYTASEKNELSPSDHHFLALYCDEDLVALLFNDGNIYKDVRTGREYDEYKEVLPIKGVISGTWIGEITK